MKNYNIEIKGVTPLLMNRFVSSDMLETTKRKVVSTKSTKVEDKIYMTEKGEIYLPARYIEGSLIEAGKNFKGKGKSNLSKIVGALFAVIPEALVLKEAKWVEDMQVGVNPMTKGRMVIHRPRFDKWSTSFILQVSTDDIPTATIKEMLDFAGLYVGVGDWRPAKKGKYGKFIVSKFSEA